MEPSQGLRTSAPAWISVIMNAARRALDFLLTANRDLTCVKRAIHGFEAMLWLRKGFGFAGPWTLHEQNRLLGVSFGLQAVNKP